MGMNLWIIKKKTDTCLHPSEKSPKEREGKGYYLFPHELSSYLENFFFFFFCYLLKFCIEEKEKKKKKDGQWAPKKTEEFTKGGEAYKKTRPTGQAYNNQTPLGRGQQKAIEDKKGIKRRLSKENDGTGRETRPCTAHTQHKEEAPTWRWE